ncbi:hypothetical protein [Xanthomonas oryzae]|nr:hypothetical protein [Xanthomonas oryzae]
MKMSETSIVPPSKESEITEASTSSASPSVPSEQVYVPSQEPTRPEGLRRRPRRVIDSVRDSSLAKTTTALAKDIAVPTTSTIASVIETGGRAIHQFRKPAISSSALQKSLSFDLSDRDQQRAAHEQLILYGNGSAHMLDRIVPFLRDVLRIGVGGTAMAFGIGRNSGLAAGDALARLQQRHPQSGAVFDNTVIKPSNNGKSLLSTSVSIAAQLGLGSIAGATGNMLGQFLVGPIINLLPRQFHTVDSRAVVPDEIVDEMNKLVPGAGTELRASVLSRQAEIIDIGSQSNIKIGQMFFDGVLAARAMALGGEQLGAAGQVSFGLAASATAGGLIGATMATRQSVSTITIPDLEYLKSLASSELTDADKAKELSELMQSPGGENAKTVEVPLFFAKHMRFDPAPDNRDLEAARTDVAQTEQRASLSSIQAGVAKATELVSAVGGVFNQAVNAVVQGFNASALKDPQPDDSSVRRRSAADVAAHTVSNVGASLIRRGQEFVKSTAATTTISTVTSLVAQPMTNIDQRLALAIGNAVGIHTAIRPWFTALSKNIPARDNLHRQQRLDAVNRQA